MLNRSPWFLILLCLYFALVSCATDLAERKRQAEASRRLGEGYIVERNFTAAFKELLKAKQLYDKDYFLQSDLGRVYSEKGKPDLAIAHFKRAIELKPDYSEALNNMGTVYLTLQQWDRAISCFNRALDSLLYATPHFALHNLGEAYRGKKDYEHSIDSYKKALQTALRFPEAHRGLGLTYTAMGNHKEAVSSLEKAVQYAPRFAAAYYDLGRAHAGRYDVEKAISAFTKVVELVPDSPLADMALAEMRKLQE